MATAGERRILLFLTALGLLGAGVRAASLSSVKSSILTKNTTKNTGSTKQNSTGAQRALAAQRAAVDSARQSGRLSRQSPRKTTQSTTKTTTKNPTKPQPPKPKPDQSSFPININLATAAELEALPRIGPAMAKRIIEHRSKVGSFLQLEDLRHIRGIGPATLTILKPLVTFSTRHSPLQSRETTHSEYHQL